MRREILTMKLPNFIEVRGFLWRWPIRFGETRELASESFLGLLVNFMAPSSAIGLKIILTGKKTLRAGRARGVLPARPRGRLNFFPIRPWPTQ